MIQILLSTLLVLVFGAIFVWSLNKVFKHNPTKLKTSFGHWLSIEAEFESPASEIRS